MWSECRTCCPSRHQRDTAAQQGLFQIQFWLKPSLAKKKERGRLIPSYFLRFQNHHDRIRRTVWYTDLYEIFITVRRSDRAAQMAKVIRYFPDQPDSNASSSSIPRRDRVFGRQKLIEDENSPGITVRGFTRPIVWFWADLRFDMIRSTVRMNWAQNL